MALTVKPTGYTVNTGHSKCPTHLWMCDEGSGTSIADQGTGTAMAMTLVNADQWDTDGTYGSMINCASGGAARYALSATGFAADTTILVVAIVQSASSVCAAQENILFAASSLGTANAKGGIDYATTEKAEIAWDDGVTAGSKSYTDVSYDTTWRFIAGKLTTNAKGISVDGNSWVTAAAAFDFPFNVASSAPNRYGLGVRPNPTPSGPFNGNILAAWVYEDGTYADWDDAWIAALYADPWQFLTTSTTPTGRMLLTGIG